MEQARELRWNSYRFAALIDASVDGLAGTKYPFITLASKLVCKSHRDSPQFTDLSTDHEEVVVAGRASIAAAGLDHGKKPAVALEVAIARSLGTQVFASTEFEIAEVIGVVHDPHLIGIAIDDPHTRLDDHGPQGR